MFTEVRYLAVLLQILKDKEFIKHQIITVERGNTAVKTHIAHHSPNNEPTIQRASGILSVLVSGQGGNKRDRG